MNTKIIAGAILLASLIIAAAILAVGNTNRYQLVVTDGTKAYVVDTKTGRLWSRLIIKNTAKSASQWHEEDSTRRD